MIRTAKGGGKESCNQGVKTVHFSGLKKSNSRRSGGGGVGVKVVEREKVVKW